MSFNSIPIIAGHHFGQCANVIYGAHEVCSLDGPVTPWIPTWAPPAGRAMYHYIVTQLASGKLVLVPRGYAGHLDADMAAFEEHKLARMRERDAEIEIERARREAEREAMREVAQEVPGWAPLAVGFRPNDGTFSISTEDGGVSGLTREEMVELGERLVSIARQPKGE